MGVTYENMTSIYQQYNIITVDSRSPTRWFKVCYTRNNQVCLSSCESFWVGLTTLKRESRLMASHGNLLGYSKDLAITRVHAKAWVLWQTTQKPIPCIVPNRGKKLQKCYADKMTTYMKNIILKYASIIVFNVQTLA